MSPPQLSQRGAAARRSREHSQQRDSPSLRRDSMGLSQSQQVLRRELGSLRRQGWHMGLLLRVCMGLPQPVQGRSLRGRFTVPCP